MKDKLKNTLEHEVELLGRSISVLAIAGLLVVGGASAALLTTYGEVTGDATVEQALTVNQQVAGEDSPFSQSFEFDGATEVTGESFSESNTINNNLESTQTVIVDSTVTEPSYDVDESYVSEDAAYSADHLLLENGETFARDDSDDGEGAEVSYEFTESGDIAVRAYVDSDNSFAEAGTWFDASGTLSSGETTATVDYEEANRHDSVRHSPDWVLMQVEVDGEDYLIVDAQVTADSGTQMTWTQDGFEWTEGDSTSTGNAVYFSVEDEWDGESKPTSSDLSQIDPNADESPDFSDFEGSEIEHVGVATGTGSGTDDGSAFDIYYTDFQFNGSSYFNPVDYSEDTEVDVPSGDSELGTAIDFDLNALPGTYDFTVSVEPQTN